MNTYVAGTSFNRVDFPIKKGDIVTIKREVGSEHDNDSSPAFAVMLEGCRIGYIPRTEPMKAKQIDADKAGDKRSHTYWKEMVNENIYLRECLYKEIMVDHETPRGTVYSVAYLENGGTWEDDSTEGLAVSIRVSFDYQ